MADAAAPAPRAADALVVADGVKGGLAAGTPRQRPGHGQVDGRSASRAMRVGTPRTGLAPMRSEPKRQRGDEDEHDRGPPAGERLAGQIAIIDGRPPGAA